MTDGNRPFDWLRFIVQFFFGAVFGAIAGIYLGSRFSTEQTPILLTTLGMAVLVGLVAGFWGDRFWYSFRDHPWLNPFRWF